LNKVDAVSQAQLLDTLGMAAAEMRLKWGWEKGILCVSARENVGVARAEARADAADGGAAGEDRLQRDELRKERRLDAVAPPPPPRACTEM
jgi:hypothetical protein